MSTKLNEELEWEEFVQEMKDSEVVDEFEIENAWEEFKESLVNF